MVQKTIYYESELSHCCRIEEPKGLMPIQDLLQPGDTVVESDVVHELVGAVDSVNGAEGAFTVV